MRTREAALVVVHPWDVAGAERAGSTGSWLDRDGATWPTFLPEPTLTVGSLEEVPGRLG